MEVKTVNFGPASNSYVVKDGGKTMLIDTGNYLNEPGWLCTLVMSGVMPDEIDLIVLTHGHADHAAGVHHAKTLTGAPLLAHKDASVFIETGKFPPYVARNALGQAFIDQIAGPAPLDVPETVTIDHPITSDTDLSEFGFNAKAILTPGHTEDSISVIFDSGEAFTGDTILDPFGEGICTFAVICPDVETLKATGKKILDTNASVFYSGHGGPFTREQAEAAYEKLINSNE